MITDDGCWADFRTLVDVTRGRPCLFLDRDGVLIEDTGYPHRPNDVVIIPETLALVRLAQDCDFRVGIVTNQSGIARGMFGWQAFAAVQAVIDEALRTVGAAVDFVLACPYHADATVLRYKRDDHGWRKPAPGMILAAARELEIDLGRSIMVGDQPSDMEAAAAASVPHRWLMRDNADLARAKGPWCPIRRGEAASFLQNLHRKTAVVG